jgi:hypothetical protein
MSGSLQIIAISLYRQGRARRDLSGGYTLRARKIMKEHVLAIRSCTYRFLAGISNRLSNDIFTLQTVFRRFPAILACSLFFIPATSYASGPVSADSNSALSGEGSAAIEERTLDATEGRVKAQESVNALSKDIQELKQSVIALNKNLRVLEEDLLFPANTQVNVFLSLDVGKFFTLESVKLKLDGQVVASHIYTDKELFALARSGIHKLHMANLSIGEHSLSAFFTGAGPNGREYKRGTSLKINKESGPKYIELKISDSSMKLQPEFSVKEW